MKHARKEGPLVVEVKRSIFVESAHLVDAVVVDVNGKIAAKYGACESLIFPRSAIKMIQALSFVESGAVESFDLSDKHIAISCASHLGETMHTKLVQEWLEKIQLQENFLECGSHFPYDESARNELIRKEQVPHAIHNNCSGKHCGMLTTALQLKESPRGYSQYDHPIQKRLRKILSELAGQNYEKIPWGVDGCSIPTYALPLESIAKSMTALLPGAKVSSERAHAAARILKSIQAEPLLISGTKGLCSQIIKISKGRVIAKTGAEGVFTALIPEQGLSIALKVHDGATRASESAIVHLLHSLGGLTEAEVLSLKITTGAILKNWSGLAVGEIVCV